MNLSEPIKHYSKTLETYGASAKGVGWNSKNSQEIRFNQLINILPNDSFSILDYGCGYGALYEFIETRKFDFSYTGYDIIPAMISKAQNIFTSNKKLEWISDRTLLDKTDYTLASGVFNVKLDIELDKWKSYVLSELELINKLSIKGFSFNILTSYSDKNMMNSDLYYAEPGFYFDYCKKHFSRNVALLHDYNLYEFTIMVRK